MLNSNSTKCTSQCLSQGVLMTSLWYTLLMLFKHVDYVFLGLGIVDTFYTILLFFWYCGHLLLRPGTTHTRLMVYLAAWVV